MRKSLLLFFLLLTLTSFASAQEVEVGMRYVQMAVIGEGGLIEVDNSLGFAVTGEVFWTERWSTQVAATFVQPTALAFPPNPPPADVDLGTLGVEPIALTARFHLRPGARIRPYVGAGGAIVKFGNLDDRFADDLEVNVERTLTFLAEGGVRLRISEHGTLDLGASYMPLSAELHVVRNDTNEVVVPDELELDTLSLFAGVSWRF